MNSLLWYLGFSLETGLDKDQEHHTATAWPEPESVQYLTTVALIIYLLRYCIEQYYVKPLNAKKDHGCPW